MARRRTETFSLSFLDVMACGLGAVVLFFMIISATMHERQDELNKHLSEQADKLRTEVNEGERNLVELRNAIEDTERRDVEARGMARRIIELMEQKQEELSRMDADTVAAREHINKLKADLKSMEEASKRLSAASSQPSDVGERLRRIEGQGRRQYLTGMQVTGNRLVILLDTSASMLDETIVNIIRRRNMPPAQRVHSAKWQRALRTTEWIVAQMQPTTKFQIISFNQTAASVLPDKEGQWLDAGDPGTVDAAIQASRKLVPEGGTSLHNAIAALKKMSPAPDNVMLVIDSLPTMAENVPIRSTVSGSARLRLFNDAVRELPGGFPVNVILFPMEGDARASPAYWRLAQITGGSFISPSEDWP